MVIRQVYHEIQSCKVLGSACLWQWLPHERFRERFKKMMFIGKENVEFSRLKGLEYWLRPTGGNQSGATKVNSMEQET
jgi:hypothetical protein